MATEREWTIPQQNAIQSRGGTVLVSAAAGSGKTAVLVERITRRLTDRKDPLEPSRLVMVTFTEAAAAEMRQRLETALRQQLEADPSDPLLRRQSLLLPTAHISTVHSFCKGLLRDHFHLLDLSPDFKILQAEQAGQLLDDAVRESVESRYGQGDTDFQLLVERFSAKKDDRPIVAAVLQLYHFVTQSFAFPEQWLNEQEAKLEDGGAAVQAVQESLFRRTLRWQLQRSLNMTDRALSMLSPEDPFAATRIPVLLCNKQFFEEMLTITETAPVEELADKLDHKPEVTMANAPKGTDPDFKKKIDNLRTGYKKCLEKVFWMESDPESDKLSRPVIRSLISLCREVKQRFSEKKREQNGLDFNDLEHLTLDLLYDNNGNKTPLAAEIARQFDEILIDEYQDTNEVQDAIFRAVSDNEQNLFFVGDVKQSIYGFRQARSKLFINQRSRGVDYDGVHYPATVLLNNNFRSRHEVTDAINHLFKRVMQRSIGGIEYDESERLNPSAIYEEPVDREYLTELTFLETDGDVDTDEAKVIAADIKRMVGRLLVGQKENRRPAQYRDFCILLRSVKGHGEVFAKELQRQGIPAVCQRRSPLLDAAEVKVALELLRFLDNPSLNISMVAAMMSPLWRFTVDELALIRLNNKKAPLFANLRQVARGEDALAEKCRNFLQQTDRWRMLAPVLTVDRLIERIYNDLSIENIYGVQKNGKQCVANLRYLHTRARDFEENGYRGLSAFVRMWDRLEESGSDIGQAFSGDTAHNAVSIITLHKSKGLEFPVVFLARAGAEFNRQDLNKAMILNADAGIGLKLHDSETYLQYATVTHRTAAEIYKIEQVEEELRMLYVALTRAREKLCIVASCRNLKGTAEELAVDPTGSGQLPEFAVATASSYIDWLMPVALLHPAAGTLRTLAEIEGNAVDVNAPDMVVRVLQQVPEETAATQAEASPADLADAAVIDGWRERVSWRYPYYEMRDIPNKLAVAAIAHRELDDRYVATAAPAFLQKSGLTPAERGTAMHQFMQFADYAAAAVSVTAERDRLAANQWLTQKQADSLAVDRLQAFFQSELYQRMANAESVHRELPFVAERPAAELFPEKAFTGQAAAELLAVQGVADCVVVESDGLLIVDYKTDRVKTEAELRDRYATQVQIYAEAMAKAFERPVKQCLLWSFTLNRAVECPIK
ncbi:MAG: helicase-exonuclease AddAB subunit AddA [Clostridia bacterium]|nr:helicase-exonuclease AddAB subunit AddA [Clostridia bacterium]